MQSEPECQADISQAPPVLSHQLSTKRYARNIAELIRIQSGAATTAWYQWSIRRRAKQEDMRAAQIHRETQAALRLMHRWRWLPTRLVETSEDQ